MKNVVKFSQQAMEQMIFVDDCGMVRRVSEPNEYFDYVFEDKGAYVVVHLVSKSDAEGFVSDSFVCHTSNVLNKGVNK